ncbi:MAG: hypothetical protein M3Z15_07555 [Pseudomonadota bacterium]|nr:hypothetical protein [Pseudomonadota bacterium]
MISFVRTGAIAPGKGAAALAFAQKIVDYWKSNYDREIEILRPIAGNPSRIAFVGRYRDLAEFDAVATKSLADTKYLELLVAGADVFIAGSIHDELWRTA